jgi:hypothetical protein
VLLAAAPIVRPLNIELIPPEVFQLKQRQGNR